MFKLGDVVKVVSDAEAQGDGESPHLGLLGRVVGIKENPNDPAPWDCEVQLSQLDGSTVNAWFYNEELMAVTRYTNLPVSYRQAGITKNGIVMVVQQIQRKREDMKVRTPDGQEFWVKAEGWSISYECDPVCNCGEPGCRGHETSGNGVYYEDPDLYED